MISERGRFAHENYTYETVKAYGIYCIFAVLHAVYAVSPNGVNPNWTDLSNSESGL